MEDASMTSLQRFQVPELLHLVFTFLSFKSLSASQRVCRAWFSLATEHLWKSVSVSDILALTVSGKRLLHLRASLVKSPRDYELAVTTAEALRLSVYASCIVILEYPYDAYVPADRHPPMFLFYQMIDRWHAFVTDYPMLFGITPQTDITIPTLFPRLRHLSGSTRDLLRPRHATRLNTKVDFTTPLNPMHGVLHPLCRIYATRATALSLIATTSTRITINSHAIEPKTFLELRRNSRLEHLEVTRLKNWVVRDDWAQIAQVAGWSTAEGSIVPVVKLPLRSLSLSMFHVAHFFTRVVEPQMFGPVMPHLRTLRLKAFLQVQHKHVSNTTRSDSDRRSGSRNSSTSSSIGLFRTGGAFSIWPRLTRRIVRTPSESSVVASARSDEDGDEPMPGRYTSRSPLDLEMERVSREEERPGNGIVPLTATALQHLDGKTITESTAADAGHQTSDDLDSSSSSDASAAAVRRIVEARHDSMDGDPVRRNHLPISSSSASYESLPSPVRTGGTASGGRLRFLTVQSPSSASERGVEEIDEPSDEDEDEDFNQPFPNIWAAPFSDEEDDDAEGDGSQASSWESASASQAAAALGPVDPPDRSFLELIARSCPELEVLSLSGGWDWSRLTAANGPGSTHCSDTDEEDEHEGIPALPRVELRVDFRGVMDEEERTKILVSGIQQTLKQWRKRCGKLRRK